MKNISMNTIKAHNIKLIFDIIANNDTITRGEIAKLSKLSLMTVSNLVDHLDKLGVIHHEDKEQTNAVGRKAELLAINKDAKKFIVLDLTSIEFTFTVLNLDLTIYYRSKDWKYNFELSYIENLKDFICIIDEYITEKPFFDNHVGLAVSVPGPYFIDNDIVINKRIPELMQVQLKALMNEVFTQKRLNEDKSDIEKSIEYDIFIDEDVKFASQSNILSVSDNMHKTIYYMYIGEGVGGVTSVDGSLLRGQFSFAGDIGQVLISDNMCFEDLISLKAFAKNIVKNVGIFGSDEDIIKMLEDYQSKNIDDFRKQLSKICIHIAQALYNVVWFIDPHAIVIECGYAGLDANFFVESIETELLKMLLPVRANIPQILLSNDSIKNAHKGAGIVARSRWLKSVS